MVLKGGNGTGGRLPQSPHHRHHGQFIAEAIHRGAHTHTGSASSQGHGHRDGRQARSTENGQGHLGRRQGTADGEGGGQGRGCFFDQAQNARTHGTGAGAPLRLDPVRPRMGQGNGQLLLLIEGQPMGNGHREHNLREQGPGALGETQNLLRLKAEAHGIEGVEIADFHHRGPSSHRRREEFRVDGGHAERQPWHEPMDALHQGRITGQIQEISAASGGGTGDPLHGGLITIGQASNHLEQPTLSKGLLQGDRQAGVTRHLHAREVVKVILPSDASPPGRRWGPDQDRLHRHLLRQPTLLPKGGSLLLALSGGQDSMALLGLLRDLQPLHGWHLSLWHGNHGWHAEAGAQAQTLQAWAARQQLPLHGQRADPPPATEAAAREWRYRCLLEQAEILACSHVLTAHTANDRAETLLLNLARGSHRRGLAALRATRPLAKGIQLVRPLLPFTRADTARICQEMALPLWIDPSNAESRFSRNRVRAEVLPVLEDLHPGATTRMAALAERLAQEEGQKEEVLAMALGSLAMAPDHEDAIAALNRRSLVTLQPANQRNLVQHWLRLHWGRPLDASSLERLLARLPLDQGPGRHDLAQGWHLRWERSQLLLFPPIDHGRPG